MNLRPAGRPLRIADVQHGFGRSTTVIGSGVFRASPSPAAGSPVEALGPKFLDAEFRAKRRERMARIRALMAKVDPDREIPKTDELWYFEEREDVGDWFRRHGWDVTVTPSDELMAGYGRRAPKQVEHEVPGNLFVAAQRT
jgi:O-methyltransferase involved in polyketide biosynthesis